MKIFQIFIKKGTLNKKALSEKLLFYQKSIFPKKISEKLGAKRVIKKDH